MSSFKARITERIDAGLDQRWREHTNEFDLVILITKAPHLLLNKDIPDNAIIHCTITGMGGTAIEPNVACPEITLDAYNKLVAKIGGERCVLRIDPIIPTTKGIATAKNLSFSTKPSCWGEKEGRLRISFLDIYPHVKEKFNKAGIPLPYPTFHAPLQDRLNALSQLPAYAEVCGEPGLPCTGCVSIRDIQALNLKLTPQTGKSTQRFACACIAEKQELLGNIERKPCPHNCLYCYWKNN